MIQYDLDIPQMVCSPGEGTIQLQVKYRVSGQRD